MNTQNIPNTQNYEDDSSCATLVLHNPVATSQIGSPNIRFDKSYSFSDLTEGQNFLAEIKVEQIEQNGDIRVLLIQSDDRTLIEKKQYSGIINSLVLNNDAVASILQHQEAIDGQLSLLTDLRQNFLDGVLTKDDVMGVLSDPMEACVLELLTSSSGNPGLGMKIQIYFEGWLVGWLGFRDLGGWLGFRG